jgi:septation ring formation regulator EzrA
MMFLFVTLEQEIFVLIFVVVVVLILSVIQIFKFKHFFDALDASKERKEEPKSGISEELKKLAELHDQGVLTDEEFFEQKEKLLR